MVSRDLPGFLAGHYLRKEKHLLGYVDAVITVNEFLKEYFEPITPAPVSVVMNAKPVIMTEYNAPRNEVFTLLYVGTLNDSRLMMGLVDAVRGLDGVRL